MAEPLTEASPADGGDLAEVQRWVLPLQVEDRLAQLGRHAVMAFEPGWRLQPA